jgi:hypothetical protein
MGLRELENGKLVAVREQGALAKGGACRLPPRRAGRG